MSRIFRGAAKRGIEALSELDASRVDLVNRKRDVNWRVIDKHLRKVMREMPPSLQGLSEYANDQQFLQAARSALGDAESADALFNAAIVALLFDARLQRARHGLAGVVLDFSPRAHPERVRARARWWYRCVSISGRLLHRAGPARRRHRWPSSNDGPGPRARL